MRVNNSLFHWFLAIGALEDFPIHPYISLFSPFLVCSLKTKFFCSVRAFQKGSRRLGKHHKKQCDINAQITTICYDTTWVTRQTCVADDRRRTAISATTRKNARWGRGHSKIFHAEIVVDSANVSAEMKTYQPIPIIAEFTNEDGSDNLKETIEANYKCVKQEVLSLVASEIERIKNDPNLKGLSKE